MLKESCGDEIVGYGCVLLGLFEHAFKVLGQRVRAQRFGADDLPPLFGGGPGRAALPLADGGGCHADQFRQARLGQAEAGAQGLDAVGVVG